jgi:hypothetical protein
MSERGSAVSRPGAPTCVLPNEQMSVIPQSHERRAALGLSRIERPDFEPLLRERPCRCARAQPAAVSRTLSR